MEPQMLVNQGLSESVAQRISEIFASGLLSPEELDDRAFDALREFDQQGALEVLDQFANSDLSHVQNKSAFLCGVMKTYVSKSSAGQAAPAETPSQADEGKVKALLDRTGYTLDITAGQRKYGGPPPGWEGPVPGTGGHEKGCCQVFVGKIPRECFEDEVIPLLEECGQIYDFRLMMDPASGLNRGFGFCTFATKAAAQNAVKKLDNKEIRPGRKLGVCISVANNRLFVGSIPKSKTKEEILTEFGRVTSDLTDVIVYMSSEQKGKNRGFAFLEYESHKAAALAKRRLQSGKVFVWGMTVAKVEWADPQEEPTEEVMAKVKVVYVRNISPTITEEKIQEEFGQYGTVERVKKIKDYAFVHFSDRQNAIMAIEALDGKLWDDIAISVSLAKPQPVNKDRGRGRGGTGMGPGSRGGQPRGGPRGRGRGGQGGYDQGYNNSGGYDSYSGGSYDDGSGYGGYYDNSSYGEGGYGGRYGSGGGYGGGSYGGGYGNDEYGGGRGGGRGGGYSNRGGGRGGPRGSRGGQGGPSRGGPRGGGGRGGSSFGRGGRGSRGGPPRGRGGEGGGRGFGGPQKRKFGGDSYQGGGGGGYSEPKRQYVDYSQQYGQQETQQQWGQDYSYGGDQGDQQWHQDSWSQAQW